MSGLEAIGIAASIIQIADLGTKLSVKLFTFYRQIQNVNQSIQSLSSDVALTCAILRELGESLKEDEQSKLCSPEAHLTAQQVLKQCEDVLRQIQEMINASDCSGKSRWQQATTKLKNVLNEPNVDLLKGNLERLKSTMLLLLNVIMFASQVRSNKVPAMLNEQRTLLESLLAEKRQQERVSSTAIHQASTAATYNSSWIQQTSARSFSNQTLAPKDAKKNELEEYNTLIRTIFRKIDDCKSKLENTRHSRIRNGVLNIHWSEIVQFQRIHGPHVFQFFETFDEVQAEPQQTDQEDTIRIDTGSVDPSGRQIFLVEPLDRTGREHDPSNYRRHAQLNYRRRPRHKAGPDENGLEILTRSTDSSGRRIILLERDESLDRAHPDYDPSSIRRHEQSTYRRRDILEPDDPPQSRTNDPGSTGAEANHDPPSRVSKVERRGESPQETRPRRNIQIDFDSIVDMGPPRPSHAWSSVCERGPSGPSADEDYYRLPPSYHVSKRSPLDRTETTPAKERADDTDDTDDALAAEIEAVFEGAGRMEETEAENLDQPGRSNPPGQSCEAQSSTANPSSTKSPSAAMQRDLQSIGAWAAPSSKPSAQSSEHSQTGKHHKVAHSDTGEGNDDQLPLQPLESGQSPPNNAQHEIDIGDPYLSAPSDPEKSDLHTSAVRLARDAEGSNHSRSPSGSSSSAWEVRVSLPSPTTPEPPGSVTISDSLRDLIIRWTTLGPNEILPLVLA